MGLPVCVYAIDGITDREIDELEQWENSRKAAGRAMRRRYMRWNRTLRGIRKRMQKGEKLNMTGVSEDALLFCSWRRGGISAELLLRFYRHCYRENVLVFRDPQ